ncbi:D-ribose pyranase [Clostridium akagii]|uniref:D-ribose pyranase n=1 Tax=Clostridium akagii TaxID=91623 RepID=UPI00047A9A1D|nr:D-ribose pyranase [Clostridium akagii]
MKKIGILNSDISEVISKMGHTDTIAIGDCGLPIPQATRRIDLALIKDVPGFIQTLKAVLIELQIEEVFIAKETVDKNKNTYNKILELASDVKINIISHEELKTKLKDCAAVIRTGEQTPFSNIILKSGVFF